MKALPGYIPLLLLPFIYSCAAVRSSAKYDFSENTYSTGFLGGKTRRVYVVPGADTTFIYPLHKTSGGTVADTTSVHVLATNNLSALRKVLLYKPSFDLDVLTILFKYRPQAGSFPRQLSTSFNGALYAGYRSDVYRLTRNRNPLGDEKYSVNHFGFSFGGFGGLGATAMNPWVTQDNINIEYDGFVFSAGLAAIIGINNLTVGVGAGIDHLTDDNRRFWIYQHKLWYGLMFGLNLN